MRPPMVTELLLSNDGDRILEGSVTNFFVVCKAECGEPNDSTYNFDKESSFELQTAPISDGVLSGVMRQIVIDVRDCAACHLSPSCVKFLCSWRFTPFVAVSGSMYLVSFTVGFVMM
ncbi:hypothetical protein KSP39_PZI010518 [Platanthera zijinensis]|uniref:Uncharacterized protein n=1 Tax=Platanthera zijinensis TaxID=2320716 RepID=A0AAP0G6U1_9ASPA